MKFRDLLTPSDLLLLMDLIRSDAPSPDAGEVLYYEVLNMEVGHVPVISPEVLERVSKQAGKEFDPGIVGRLVDFAFRLRPDGALQSYFDALPPPGGDTPGSVPWNPGTEVYDFFLFLFQGERTMADAELRWPPEVVDNLWKYFEGPHIGKFGLRSICGKTREGVDTLRIERR